MNKTDLKDGMVVELRNEKKKLYGQMTYMK